MLIKFFQRCFYEKYASSVRPKTNEVWMILSVIKRNEDENDIVSRLPEREMGLSGGTCLSVFLETKRLRQMIRQQQLTS